MEDFNTIKANVFHYLNNNSETTYTKDKYSLSISKVSEITNTNYLIEITNKDTNQVEDQLLYRKFGKISECVDRELESTIIDKLSEEGVAPKILYKDEKGEYRIEEYIPDSTSIKKENQFKSDIIEQIIQICVSYSLISSIYRFTVISDGLMEKLSITINCNDDLRRKKIDSMIHNNIFDMSLNNLYEKAMKSFTAFAEKFKSTVEYAANSSLYKDFEKMELFMNNFKFLFMSVFPKKGNMILNHNDLHRKNLIIEKTNSKIFVLDHEYAALNLIGIDIANYLNESIFDYSPKYKCDMDKIDIDHYYDIYLQYVDKFEDANPELNETENGRELLDEIKSKKYYLNLHGVINAFWVLYCAIYLNYDNYIEEKGFKFLQHGVDRITYFEQIMSQLEEEDDDMIDMVMLDFI